MQKSYKNFSPRESMDQYLKVHVNPLTVDRGIKEIEEKKYEKPKNVKFIGGEKLIKECTDGIIDYFNKGFRNVARTNECKPFLLSIRGELGSGKTLFGRALVTSI
jgi:hypothetical protein